VSDVSSTPFGLAISGDVETSIMLEDSVSRARDLVASRVEHDCRRDIDGEEGSAPDCFVHHGDADAFVHLFGVHPFTGVRSACPNINTPPERPVRSPV
jgi:hypothetical protein